MTTQSPTPTPIPSQNRFATHRHHRLAYGVVPSSSPSSPTLVLLHSLLAGRAEFTPLRDALAGRARLILPDARGHGASAAIPDQRYTIATAVSELDAILQDAAAPHTHLLGHEFGAAVALAFALAHPDRVRSLTLIDPTTAAVLTGDPDTALAVLAAESLRQDSLAADSAYKGLIDRALDQYLAPRRGPAWRETTPRPAAAAIRRHASSLAGILPALIAYTPDHVPLSALAIPTVVHSTPSPYPPARATAERLAAVIPHARLVVLPTPNPNPDPSLNPESPGPNPLADAAAAALAATLTDRLFRR